MATASSGNEGSEPFSHRPIRLGREAGGFGRGFFLVAALLLLGGALPALRNLAIGFLLGRNNVLSRLLRFRGGALVGRCDRPRPRHGPQGFRRGRRGRERGVGRRRVERERPAYRLRLWHRRGRERRRETAQRIV